MKYAHLTHDLLPALAAENNGDVDKPLRAAASSMWDRLKEGGSSEAILAATGANLRASRILFELARLNQLIRREPWAAGSYRYVRDTTDPHAFMDLAHQIADAWRGQNVAKPAPHTAITAKNRRMVHHLLSAIECTGDDVPLTLRDAVETMCKLDKENDFVWSHYIMRADPNAAQAAWIIGHSARLLQVKPSPIMDGFTRFTLPDPGDLLTAIDDTVALWRHGLLLEDTIANTAPQRGPNSLNGMACDGTHRLLDALAVDCDDVGVALDLAIDLLCFVNVGGPFTWRDYLKADGESLAALVVFNIGCDTETVRVHEGCRGADNTYFVPKITDLRAAVHRRLAAWREVVTTRDVEPMKPKNAGMTRNDAIEAIRNFLNASFRGTGYPLTVEPEPGKIGYWRFQVLTTDARSWLKPDGRIDWNGSDWRKPIANRAADLVPSTNDPAVVHIKTVMPSPPTPEPPMTEQPKPLSLYEQVAALMAERSENERARRHELEIKLRGASMSAFGRIAARLAAGTSDYDTKIEAVRLTTLNDPFDPDRVFADTDAAKANMEAAIAAMADPWYQPFNRKDFILRGPVEQTDARKALFHVVTLMKALTIDYDRDDTALFSVPFGSAFSDTARRLISNAKATWRRSGEF